jgi:hypothetical protein
MNVGSRNPGAEIFYGKEAMSSSKDGSGEFETSDVRKIVLNRYRRSGARSLEVNNYLRPSKDFGTVTDGRYENRECAYNFPKLVYP